MQIKQAWDFAYQQLTAPSDPSESLLERIIRVDTVLTDRPRPVDPPVPEQLEQEIRDQLHHRSKQSRHHKEDKHRDRDSKHRDKDSKHRDNGSRHKDKKRRRERSVEFTDPDPDVEPETGRLHRSSCKEEDRSHKRQKHKSGRHRKSDSHRSSTELSPSAIRPSKHIRFN